MKNWKSIVSVYVCVSEVIRFFAFSFLFSLPLSPSLRLSFSLFLLKTFHTRRHHRHNTIPIQTRAFFLPLVLTIFAKVCPSILSLKVYHNIRIFADNEDNSLVFLPIIWHGEKRCSEQCTYLRGFLFCLN